MKDQKKLITNKEFDSLLDSFWENELNWKYQYPKEYNKWKKYMNLNIDIEDIIQK